MKAAETNNDQSSATGAKASVVQPAPASGAISAAQPVPTNQNYQSFNVLLSKQSAKFGKFKVIVCQPWQDTYTYTWEGKTKETTAWRCVLVSADDPTVYCTGEYKLTTNNKAFFDKHFMAKKHGTTVIMSSVALVENIKTQYMSSSVRVSVNMALTKLTTVLEDRSAVQPVPTTTVAETKQIQQNQSFDLTAFVLSRSEPRHGGEGRKAFDLELVDGSKDEASGKVQTMSFTVFASDAAVAKLHAFADSCITQQEPVSFFNLRGEKDARQDAFSFSSARSGFSMIVADSSPALEMRSRSPELYNLDDKAPVPQKKWTPNESCSSQSATLTTVKSLRDMGTPVTGVEDIDTQSTLWQLNWIQVVEPAQGTPLRNGNGLRLWFPILLRDFHGSMTMYITETAALKCSKQPDAASFEEAHRAGRLSFPIVASVKILRKKGDDSNVNFYVVDCEEQEYDSAPTTKTFDLLKLLPRQSKNDSVEQPADTFVAALLADIHASTFYPLTVRYAEQTLPDTLIPLNFRSADSVKKGTAICNCTSVLALVASNKPSQKDTVNESGTTVTTHDVKDLLADDGREYTLTAHCTTDTHMDFMLTPPKRATQQAALVVICGTLDHNNSGTSAEQPARNFLVESILPLHDRDVQGAKASLLKLISLIAFAGQSGAMKRENSGWSANESPAKMAKCRSIARYPTGDEIPAYSKPV